MTPPTKESYQRSASYPKRRKPNHYRHPRPGSLLPGSLFLGNRLRHGDTLGMREVGERRMYLFHSRREVWAYRFDLSRGQGNREIGREILPRRGIDENREEIRKYQRIQWSRSIDERVRVAWGQNSEGEGLWQDRIPRLIHAASTTPIFPMLDIFREEWAREYSRFMG